MSHHGRHGNIFGMCQGHSYGKTFKSFHPCFYCTQRAWTGTIGKLFVSSINIGHHGCHGTIFGMKILPNSRYFAFTQHHLQQHHLKLFMNSVRQHLKIAMKKVSIFFLFLVCQNLYWKTCDSRGGGLHSFSALLVCNLSCFGD